MENTHMKLDGKVALVTGGTSGIGKDAAIALANEGASVVVAGRREAEGQAVVSAIQKAGRKARFVQTDIGKEGDVKNLVAETIKTFGRLDVAFNNAGVEIAGPIVDTTVEDYRRVFDINVLGVLLSMKYEIPEMLKVGGGSIINTSSIAGHVGMGGVSVYVASKHAVEGLTKSTALEYALQKIRVNAIAPAAIDTEMLDRFAGEKEGEGRKQMAAMHPVGRTGTANEVSSAVVYLASPEASFVTGISLPVDGGWLAK